jgi:hypothetical protein
LLARQQNLLHLLALRWLDNLTRIRWLDYLIDLKIVVLCVSLLYKYTLKTECQRKTTSTCCRILRSSIFPLFQARLRYAVIPLSHNLQSLHLIKQSKESPKLNRTMYNPESNEQAPLAASNSKNRSSNYESTSTKGKLLPLNYRPSKYSVILGPSKAHQTAKGNHHMREIAETALLHKYAKATSRLAKSRIVNTVVNMIHMKCPNGGAFVRFANGRWNEVDEHVARKKVGYLFRELLNDKYRSSTKSKMARRRREQDQSTHDMEQQQEHPSPTFISSARQSGVDVPINGNPIFPSMLPSMDFLPFPESRAFSSIEKVLQDGFKVIADSQKALGYGLEAFCQKGVVNPRKGEQATRKREFLQEACDILLRDLDIDTEDLSDLDISKVFEL